MRSIRMPYVVAPPTGTRIRTRLRLTPADEQVVTAVGRHLATLAGQDLAWRCRRGLHADQRTERKRSLTAESSSRWAGTITRTANDQWKRGYRNLLDARTGLRRAIFAIDRRLAVPINGRHGRTRGYASRVERYQKQRRLQHLQAKLAEVERRLAEGRVSVCRGGRRLARLRHHLDTAGLPASEWRGRWQAERLFLTADGEAEACWGNLTIRVHPDEQWLELRLPTPLAPLSNTSGRVATYRLSAPVVFNYRADQWAAQAATGAVRYDITYQPDRGRWYLDASWRLPAAELPSLEELRQERTLAVDLNADHVACGVLDSAGNPVGKPTTVPLDLDGQVTACRDGRLRAAISQLIALANGHGCKSIMVEDLNFTDIRWAGRETLGHGRRGKSFRRTIAGIPTGRFRELLVGMATNAGLWVVAVDPAYTSKWGRQHWLAPLHRTSPATATVHHAAAVVIGRRGLGHNARRRPGVTGHDQRIVAGELPARPSIRLRAVGEPDQQKASGQRRSPRKTRQAGSQEVRGPGGSGLFGTTRAGLTPAYLIGTVARQVQSPPTGCRPQPP
jgi:hypothetical protein